MKIDLSKIDTEHFNVKSGIIAGEECCLVTPKLLSTPWNKDNVIFRSSIWNKDGEPVSLSFKKFTNWGEREDLFPLPNSLTNTIGVAKIDGSALIVSKYKGQLITRTRGTFDVSSLDNGAEIELLKEKYPLVFDQSKWDIDTFGESETWPFSYIYEWTTPTQKIVLDYGKEPQLHLIGIIKHEDYSLASQKSLDLVAKAYNVNRPESHLFTDIEDMINTIKKWVGLEGICLYFNGDQDILKIKSLDYVKKHYFRSTCNLNSLLDLLFEWNCETFSEFSSRIAKEFDWECMIMASDLIAQIRSASLSGQLILASLLGIVNSYSHLSQKDFALLVLEKHKDDASIMFELRAKGKASNKSCRKIIERKLGILK